MSINVTAPVNQLGYGILALNVLLELEKAGMQPNFWPIGLVECPDEHIPVLQEMRNRTNNFNRDSISLRIWHPHDLSHHPSNRRACLTMFELNRLKSYEINHLKSQDEIFVPSKWHKRILQENGFRQENVHVAPLGVNHDLFSPAQNYQSEDTVFINVGKWEVRKGHDFLLEAFCAAFEPTDKVRLVMLCDNPCFRSQEEYERYNKEWMTLYKNSKMGSRIEIFPRLKTQSEVAQVMANADCGLFPSRGEGWNLDLAEMLSMGKNCIATYYSAHTEFINEHNCRLIEIENLEDAHDGVWFDASSPEWEGQPGQWAHLGQGQLDQMVSHMREIHQKKQSGELQVNQWGIDTMRHFTWANTVDCILDALKH